MHPKTTRRWGLEYRCRGFIGMKFFNPFFFESKPLKKIVHQRSSHRWSQDAKGFYVAPPVSRFTPAHFCVGKTPLGRSPLRGRELWVNPGSHRAFGRDGEPSKFRPRPLPDVRSLSFWDFCFLFLLAILVSYLKILGVPHFCLFDLFLNFVSHFLFSILSCTAFGVWNIDPFLPAIEMMLVS